MSDAIEKVPAEARWQIAAKGLTGAIMFLGNALRQEVGEEKFNAVARALWYQAGKDLKEFVAAFGLPVEGAMRIEEAGEMAVLTSMGPEFKFEVVEAGQDRCVARYSRCPWYERHKEQGIGIDLCTFGHGCWGEGFVESVNPDFSYRVSKSMPRGAPYCEVIIERKK